MFPWLEGFWLLAAGAAALALFATGVIPLVISVTLAALGESALHRFGRIRVWGTVGFLVLVVLFPVMLHAFQRAAFLCRAPAGPSEPVPVGDVPRGIVVDPPLRAVAWRIPETAPRQRRARRAAGSSFAATVPFVRLLVLSFGDLPVLPGADESLPTLSSRSRARARDAQSDVDSHAAAGDPAASPSRARHCAASARAVLLGGGLAAGGLRWLVCGLAHDLRAIYAVQLLHGVTVAGVGVGSALYVEASVPRGCVRPCQGLNATAGVGIGSILSNVAAGWLMDHVGVNAPFVVGGAARCCSR